MIAFETVAELPFASETVRVALNVPDDAKVCDCAWFLSFQVTLAVPSPKESTSCVMAVLPWVEPEALNVTASGDAPELGVTVSWAAGLVTVLAVVLAVTVV